MMLRGSTYLILVWVLSTVLDYPLIAAEVEKPILKEGLWEITITQLDATHSDKGVQRELTEPFKISDCIQKGLSQDPLKFISKMLPGNKCSAVKTKYGPGTLNWEGKCYENAIHADVSMQMAFTSFSFELHQTAVYQSGDGKKIGFRSEITGWRIGECRKY